jgi:hypothetical protein
MVKFAPGMKVRCIDDTFVNTEIHPFKYEEINLPIRGEVYIIRDVVNNIKYGVGIRLKEVKNQQQYYKYLERFDEPTFKAERFKKVRNNKYIYF